MLSPEVVLHPCGTLTSHYRIVAGLLEEWKESAAARVASAFPSWLCGKPLTCNSSADLDFFAQCERLTLERALAGRSPGPLTILAATVHAACDVALLGSISMSSVQIARMRWLASQLRGHLGPAMQRDLEALWRLDSHSELSSSESLCGSLISEMLAFVEALKPGSTVAVIGDCSDRALGDTVQLGCDGPLIDFAVTRFDAMFAPKWFAGLPAGSHALALSEVGRLVATSGHACIAFGSVASRDPLMAFCGEARLSLVHLWQPDGCNHGVAMLGACP